MMKIEQQITKGLMVLIVGAGAILRADMAAADDTAIRQGVGRLLPDATIDKIVASPVSGLFEVTIGPSLFYVSADGRYLLKGNILDLNTREDLTENKIAQARNATLEKIPESRMIIFAPEHPKHTITVFTDIDCGYCRRLHQGIADFMQEGIKVRYLFFPRAGIDSPSYDKAVTVWCSADRKQAITDAKAGKELPKLTCDNPVREHMHLGELMGVTGTPTIILEDGRLLPGFVPAERMAAYLNSAKK